MIRAVIFDLDGTLVQTEKLKAISYARAARELCPNCATEEAVVEGFREVVGRSREEVARALMERFGLEQASRARMAEFGVSAPWQAFVQVRLRIYEEMLADAEVLRRNQRPEVVELVHESRRRGYRMTLTSMSDCAALLHVLEAIELADAFEFIASGDDVECGKPDPEIYQVVLRQLGLAPKECLALEDSLTGIQSALAAGVWCIAATTPFTVAQVREAARSQAAHRLDERWVVDDRGSLRAVFDQMIAERARD